MSSKVKLFSHQGCCFCQRGFSSKHKPFNVFVYTLNSPLLHFQENTPPNQRFSASIIQFVTPEPTLSHNPCLLSMQKKFANLCQNILTNSNANHSVLIDENKIFSNEHDITAIKMEYDVKNFNSNDMPIIQFFLKELCKYNKTSSIKLLISAIQDQTLKNKLLKQNFDPKYKKPFPSTITAPISHVPFPSTITAPIFPCSISHVFKTCATFEFSFSTQQTGQILKNLFTKLNGKQIFSKPVCNNNKNFYNYLPKLNPPPSRSFMLNNNIPLVLKNDVPTLPKISKIHKFSPKSQPCFFPIFRGKHFKK